MSKRINNIIKVRDDYEPIELVFECEELLPDSQFTNQKDGKTCSIVDLRKRIEPWLTALFQSEHLSLLVGSGLTSATQSLAGIRPSSSMSDTDIFESYRDEIRKAAESSAIQSGRKKANIEDCFRVASDLLRGLDILSQSDSDFASDYERLKTEYNNNIKRFSESILNIENSILSSDEIYKKQAVNALISFLLSFASTSGTRDRLSIFTTNYDRIIEMASDVAGIRLIDRFVGSLSPIFRSSRLDTDIIYNPPGMRGEPRFLEGVVRFSKLHGSLDWIEYDNDIRRLAVPFGVKSLEPFLPNDEKAYSKLMIFPNSSKDKETSEYPYVELFRDYASAICRPNSTLVTYGYSFGDDHINRVIKDMLSIPSTHLVIISYDDNSGRIMDKYQTWGKQNQMSLLIGEKVASLDVLVDYFLPKPAIDTATIRMNKIIKQRNEQTGILIQDSLGEERE